MATKKVLKHKRSGVTGKKPLPSGLEYGELAINYSSDGEFIATKNSNNDVVTFDRAVTYAKTGEGSGKTNYKSIEIKGSTGNVVTGKSSAAFGNNLIVNKDNAVAVGQYNLDSGNCIFTVGCGTEEVGRNAFQVDEDGNSQFSGKVRIGDYVELDRDLYSRGTVEANKVLAPYAQFSQITGDVTFSGGTVQISGGSGDTSTLFVAKRGHIEELNSTSGHAGALQVDYLNVTQSFSGGPTFKADYITANMGLSAETIHANNEISASNGKFSMITDDSGNTYVKSNELSGWPGDFYTFVEEYNADEDVIATSLVDLEGRVSELESGGSVTVPIATTATTGVVMVGSGLSIDSSNGKLSLDKEYLPLTGGTLARNSVIAMPGENSDFSTSTITADFVSAREGCFNTLKDWSGNHTYALDSDVSGFSRDISALSGAIDGVYYTIHGVQDNLDDLISNYNDDEEVISASINDLNIRLTDVETGGTIIETATTASTGVIMVGSGLSIDSSNGKLSLDKEYLPLTGGQMSNGANISIQGENATITLFDGQVESHIVSGENGYFGSLYDWDGNRFVIESEITEFSNDINDLSGYVTDIQDNLGDLISNYNDDEQVISASLNNLNDRLVNLETGGTPAIVPTATTSVAGVVKVGGGLSVTSDGTLSVTGGSGQVSIATTASTGVIMVGSGLSIDSSNGKMSLDKEYLAKTGGTLTGNLTVDGSNKSITITGSNSSISATSVSAGTVNATTANATTVNGSTGYFPTLKTANNGVDYITTNYTGFAASGHNHDDKYSPTGHTHSEYLEKTGGTLTGNLTVDGSNKSITITGSNSSISATSVSAGTVSATSANVTTVNGGTGYFPTLKTASNGVDYVTTNYTGFAASGHNHDDKYSPTGHTHGQYAENSGDTLTGLYEFNDSNSTTTISIDSNTGVISAGTAYIPDLYTSVSGSGGHKYLNTSNVDNTTIKTNTGGNLTVNYDTDTMGVVDGKLSVNVDNFQVKLNDVSGTAGYNFATINGISLLQGTNIEIGSSTGGGVSRSEMENYVNQQISGKTISKTGDTVTGLYTFKDGTGLTNNTTAYINSSQGLISATTFSGGTAYIPTFKSGTGSTDVELALSTSGFSLKDELSTADDHNVAKISSNSNHAGELTLYGQTSKVQAQNGQFANLTKDGTKPYLTTDNVASANTVGVVKPSSGNGLSVDANGALSIKAGNGLTFDETGALQVKNSSGLTFASPGVLVADIDNATLQFVHGSSTGAPITVNTSNLTKASSSSAGVVKVATGSGLSVATDGTVAVKLGTGLGFDASGNVISTGGSVSDDYLPLSGGTLTGNLVGQKATFNSGLTVDNASSLSGGAAVIQGAIVSQHKTDDTMYTGVTIDTNASGNGVVTLNGSGASITLTGSSSSINAKTVKGALVSATTIQAGNNFSGGSVYLLGEIRTGKISSTTDGDVTLFGTSMSTDSNGKGTVSATNGYFTTLKTASDGVSYVTATDLSGYLPKSGGTLTGSLSGTVATFNSALIHDGFEAGSGSSLSGGAAVIQGALTSQYKSGNNMLTGVTIDTDASGNGSVSVNGTGSVSAQNGYFPTLKTASNGVNYVKSTDLADYVTTAYTGFAAANHTHSTYLPKSGGTLTGSLSGTVATFNSALIHEGFEAGSGSSLSGGAAVIQGALTSQYKSGNNMLTGVTIDTDASGNGSVSVNGSVASVTLTGSSATISLTGSSSSIKAKTVSANTVNANEATFRGEVFAPTLNLGSTGQISGGIAQFQDRIETFTVSGEGISAETLIGTVMSTDANGKGTVSAETGYFQTLKTASNGIAYLKATDVDGSTIEVNSNGKLHVIGGGASGDYLPLTGGTLTGNLVGQKATFNGGLAVDNASSISGGAAVIQGAIVSQHKTDDTMYTGVTIDTNASGNGVITLNGSGASITLTGSSSSINAKTVKGALVSATTIQASNDFSGGSVYTLGEIRTGKISSTTDGDVTLFGTSMSTDSNGKGTVSATNGYFPTLKTASDGTAYLKATDVDGSTIEVNSNGQLHVIGGSVSGDYLPLVNGGSIKANTGTSESPAYVTGVTITATKDSNNKVDGSITVNGSGGSITMPGSAATFTMAGQNAVLQAQTITGHTVKAQTINASWDNDKSSGITIGSEGLTYATYQNYGTEPTWKKTFKLDQDKNGFTLTDTKVLTGVSETHTAAELHTSLNTTSNEGSGVFKVYGRDSVIEAVSGSVIGMNGYFSTLKTASDGTTYLKATDVDGSTIEVNSNGKLHVIGGSVSGDYLPLVDGGSIKANTGTPESPAYVTGVTITATKDSNNKVDGSITINGSGGSITMPGSAATFTMTGQNASIKAKTVSGNTVKGALVSATTIQASNDFSGSSVYTLGEIKTGKIVNTPQGDKAVFGTSMSTDADGNGTISTTKLSADGATFDNDYVKPNPNDHKYYKFSLSISDTTDGGLVQTILSGDTEGVVSGSAYTNYLDETGFTMMNSQSQMCVYAYDGVHQGSDANLKADMLELSDDLAEKAASFKMKTFKWMSDENETIHFGAIAQEVEAAGFKTLVQTLPNGYKGLNYTELLSLKVAYLEKELDKMKERLDKLEKN